MERLKEFGRKVAEVREAKGYTQADVEKRAGLCPGGLSSYETGACYPRVRTLITLARLFGVSIDYLLSMDEEPKEQKKPACNMAEAALEIEHNVSGALWVDEDGVLTVSSVLAKHFVNDAKMRNLLREGVITADLYNAWRTGEMEGLKAVPIKSDHP